MHMVIVLSVFVLYLSFFLCLGEAMHMAFVLSVFVLHFSVFW